MYRTKRSNSGLTAVEVIGALVLLAAAVAIFFYVYNRNILPQQTLQTAREEPERIFTLSATAEQNADGTWQITGKLANPTAQRLPGGECLWCVYLLDGNDEATLLPHEFASSWSPDQNILFEVQVEPNWYTDFERVVDEVPEGARLLYVPPPIANEFSALVANPPKRDTAEWRRYQELRERCLVAEIVVVESAE